MFRGGKKELEQQCVYTVCLAHIPLGYIFLARLVIYQQTDGKSKYVAHFKYGHVVADLYYKVFHRNKVLHLGIYLCLLNQFNSFELFVGGGLETCTKCDFIKKEFPLLLSDSKQNKMTMYLSYLIENLDATNYNLIDIRPYLYCIY